MFDRLKKLIIRLRKLIKTVDLFNFMLKILSEKGDKMKKSIIGYCPICHDKLIVKTLRCNHCDTEITGDFTLNPFDYLSKEQLDFALVFIKNQGNIKNIEKDLGISYPTVKKNIEDLCLALNIKTKTDEEYAEELREETKRRLKNGEITFEDAERILGEL